MSLQTLIDQCELSGVVMRLEDGAIKLRGAPDAVKSAADRLRPHKAALLEYLRRQHADNYQTRDMVAEFMEVDGLSLEEAQAMAAISVVPRPAAEWIAMIGKLDGLINRYCEAYRLSADAKDRINKIRQGQSLASIPAALEWFSHELQGMSVPHKDRAR
jgi:hypothetical protein